VWHNPTNLRLGMLHPRNCIQSESLFTRDDGTYSSQKYDNLGFDCTTDEFDRYIVLFKEYIDVFAWSYDDLKAYDKKIFQYIIPLQEEVKIFKKKIIIMNPKSKPLVKVELEKLKKDGITYPIRHYDWISNPIIVIKKTG
jgi:hypothetical protein